MSDEHGQRRPECSSRFLETCSGLLFVGALVWGCSNDDPAKQPPWKAQVESVFEPQKVQAETCPPESKEWLATMVQHIESSSMGSDAFVDLEIWDALDSKTREQLAKTIEACGNEGMTRLYISIRDAKSGRKLAQLTPFQGYQALE